jgi:hypothetical protein
MSAPGGSGFDEAPPRWPEDTEPPAAAPHRDRTALAWVLLALTIPAGIVTTVMGIWFVSRMGAESAAPWVGIVAALPIAAAVVGMTVAASVLGYRQWRRTGGRAPFVASVVGGVWATYAVANLVLGVPLLLLPGLLLVAAFVALRWHAGGFAVTPHHRHHHID